MYKHHQDILTIPILSNNIDFHYSLLLHIKNYNANKCHLTKFYHKSLDLLINYSHHEHHHKHLFLLYQSKPNFYINLYSRKHLHHHNSKCQHLEQSKITLLMFNWYPPYAHNNLNCLQRTILLKFYHPKPNKCYSVQQTLNVNLKDIFQESTHNRHNLSKY